ncbi:MAG: helicase-exonuclease AddAB subunit AddA [Clostridia bacterium]|nr:helicase-exonuclease AddAB subunit AddA [Clostridia bacterium]
MEKKKPDWTNEQKNAINDCTSDILVSAAAGSGKTAVLTERLIRKITDPDLPIDVSRILVVTFTEDAANELKVRIRDAISAAMAEHPENKHLKRQYLMLPNAKISTIHGFCLDLIRSNYEILGLPPKLRVADDGQNSLMMQQVADAVIDGYYSALPEYSDIENFVEFADNFITVQDSSLTKVIIEIYKKLQSFPDGIDFITKSFPEYEKASNDVSSTLWCKVLFSHVKNTLNYHLKMLEEAVDEISEYSDISGVYLPAFEASIDGIKTVLNAVETGSYESVNETINSINHKRIGSKKGYDDDDVLKYCKKLRTNYSDQFKKLKENYFSFTDDALRFSAEKSKDYLSKLHKLLKAFDRKFSYEKRKRGIIDFNDMERMAYSLLVASDGSYTALADEVGARFDEVCIDEYQDVNSLQDGIFKSITRSTNRFMVGDIKQSIYGFRGAEPRIFADYRLDDSVKLIPLTYNFRSDETVVDFSNEICGNLFTKYGKTVPYDDSDKLHFANGSNERQAPEIVVIEDEDTTEQEVDDYSDEDNLNEDCEVNAEANYVAKRINDLVNSGVSPSDIAILLRSAKSEAKKFEDALAVYGIQSKNKEQKDLFSNAEVMLLMCILNVIDNPSRDIYLAGALKSPLYNLTISELAEIRNHAPEATLYEALIKYTKDFSFKKGEFFLSKLEEYRKLANRPVDRLIWHIYCDSGLLAFASENRLSSRGGKANLMRLYEKARSFESGTFKGLYNFIRYINDILNSDKVITSPSTNEDDGIVQIMTIHKSKGLQFKYVFLCGTAKRFNTKDESADIILDKNIGTSLKLSDESGLATVDTLYRRVSALEIRKKNLEEEIRVLYVAMTRAKSKLVIVATVKDAEKLKELNKLKKYTHLADGYVYTQYKNFISWILLSEESVVPTYAKATDILSPAGDTDDEETSSDVILDEEKIEVLKKEFASRFAFKYPSREAAGIPAKLSVSELYPTILDDYDDSEKMSEKKKPRMRVPRFIDENESRGAMIGTATHQFMQFCDFDLLEKNGIDSEITRLTDLGFLSPSVSSIVSKIAVERFIKSELFVRLKNAKSINRELRFNVHLNASSFTERKDEMLKNETVLVQGVIDCLYESDNGKTVLLDYKTDSVPKDMSVSDAEAMLIERHLTQLSYYAAACKTITGKEVDSVVIYSFALGKSIEIPNDKLIKL